MQLPDLSLLVVMVLFWATFFVLKALVFKPLGGILAEREDSAKTASSALETALANQKDTLAEIDRRMTDARREAVAARQAARAEANAKRTQVLEAAREKSREKAAAAQAALEKEIAAAREELGRSARATAAEIATQALGRRIA